MKILEIIRIILCGIEIFYLIKYLILFLNKKTPYEERVGLFISLIFISMAIIIILAGITYTTIDEDSSCSQVPMYTI